MPFTLMIQADNLAIAQAALNGVVRALAEEISPLSDQASCDIHPELPFTNDIEKWVDEAPDQVPPALPAVAAEVEPLKKRGRKPKLAEAPVEDVEPSAEVLTQEEEPEAEGAVDSQEPVKADGVTEEQLRGKVREIMDRHGMQAAIDRLKKAGYRAVKEVPPEDYDRTYKLISVA